ncbi:MAG: hypothetical protein DME16_02815 [Candidatus Rokuibacteriota bacterium]|nr:MAG: hypothetical protein DME16_02815 [Candidatus Rokubacteria bacterium]
MPTAPSRLAPCHQGGNPVNSRRLGRSALIFNGSSRGEDMAKQPGKTRREFLRDAAVAAGGAALAGALPAVDAVAQGAKAPEPKLGAQLIGKLEGPELILDHAKWPKKLAEAPMLADLVKAGKLPPVEKRVPEEPMVVKPLHTIGRYGVV